jgi:hypothetical protein
MADGPHINIDRNEYEQVHAFPPGTTFGKPRDLWTVFSVGMAFAICGALVAWGYGGWAVLLPIPGGAIAGMAVAGLFPSKLFNTIR